MVFITSRSALQLRAAHHRAEAGDDPRRVVAQLQQPIHGIDAAADPRAGEVVQLRIARRRRDVADGEHVRVAEEDVDVAARVRFDQVAVVDALAAGVHRSRRRGRSWWDAPPADEAAGSDPPPASTSASPSRAGCSRGRRSWRPPCRSASLAPVFSGCQWVLNTVRDATAWATTAAATPSAVAELRRAAVHEHQAVGGRERQHVGAAARHERQPVVQRDEARRQTGPRPSARQDQAAKQAAGDPAKSCLRSSLTVEQASGRG